MPGSDTFKICVLAYDGMDFLDFGGPVEVLSHARDASGERLAEVTVAADLERNGTGAGVIITRDVSIDDVLPRIGDFDILIVPGGSGFSAENIPDQPGMLAAVKAFSQLPARPDRYRGLVSICAGVFFLAVQGVLKGKRVTGHYRSLDDLQKVCDRNGGSKVVRQVYVDAGPLDANGINVITSASISTGLDCTLYLIEKVWGLDTAERARAVLDYQWRREVLPYGF